MTRQASYLIVAAFLLAGCGGGEGDSTNITINVPPTAEAGAGGSSSMGGSSGSTQAEAGSDSGVSGSGGGSGTDAGGAGGSDSGASGTGGSGDSGTGGTSGSGGTFTGGSGGSDSGTGGTSGSSGSDAGTGGSSGSSGSGSGTGGGTSGTGGTSGSGGSDAGTGGGTSGSGGSSGTGGTSGSGGSSTGGSGGTDSGTGGTSSGGSGGSDAGTGGSGGSDAGLVCTWPLEDCNHNAADGCETNLETTASSCGACGNPCQGAHATGLCQWATCNLLCDPGWENCNGLLADGCETPLDTMNNCGGCNIKCNSGTEVCQNLACTQVICPAGVGNCDGNASNGCETDTTTLTNCGGCNIKCIAPTNMVASCTGACQYACLDGFADCNGNLADGCEVNLKSDPYHCGACLNSVCSSTGGTPSCNEGVCQIACTGVNQNCNGQVSDGCEVNTTSDPNNCLGCGNQCYPAPHTTTAACTPSGCGVGVCQAGWDNCNGTVGDGCEVNVLGNDVNNCGGCGVKCIGGGTCNAGSCQYPVTEITTLQSGSIVQMAEDTANLYWTSKDTSNPGIYMMPKVGGSPVKVASGTSPSGIGIRGGYIYWSDQAVDAKIMRTAIGTWATTTLYNASSITGSYTNTPDTVATHIQVNDSYVFFHTAERKSCPTQAWDRIGNLVKVPVGGGNATFLNVNKNLGAVIGISSQARDAASGFANTVYVASCPASSVGDSWKKPTWTNASIARVDSTNDSVTLVTSIEYPTSWALWKSPVIRATIWAEPTSIRRQWNTQFIYAAPGTEAILDVSTDSQYIASGDKNGYVYLSKEINMGNNLSVDTRNLAVNQGVVKVLVMDDTSVYWVTTDVQGDHIRKASR